MELEHLVIRRPEFVADSKIKPEISVLVQTNSKRIPLNLEKLKTGQTVWLKWSSGPIVAKAKILSWHHGKIKGGDVNYARELTAGTKLFYLNEYWNNISKKNNCFFVVVRLSNGEWLDKPIHLNARAYGSSWIYLDNEEKRKKWLSDYSP